MISFSSLQGIPLTFFSFPLMFIYFWEREHAGEERERAGEGRREREKERERIPSRLHVVSTEPNAGLEHTNYEIMTWADTESDLSLTEPPSCPTFPFSCHKLGGEWIPRKSFCFIPWTEKYSDSVFSCCLQPVQYIFSRKPCVKIASI